MMISQKNAVKNVFDEKLNKQVFEKGKVFEGK
jgi:hypothetical protein